ncbi:uncharacterized protein LOC125000567 isoform X2 [Mugil cephalus]|uniref:uncharacterized protein LOC125000567 isoform X2 n=1 Tax=Mugil cephalus TaxID=48193 RepID=UPI001FB6961D|nr:uncharacterized protein LOC125000567 isoform X2 [Mugil cephalus]
MDGLWIILVALSGVVSSSHGWISVPTLKVKVRPGDNVTLYCDCRQSGVYIVWFRNCSHENQPTLVLRVKDYYEWTDTHFEFVKNVSTDSYDLLITNVTDSDEGLYYCGTEKPVVEEKEYIISRHIYTHGNIKTKLILAKDHQVNEQNADTGQTRLNQGEDVCYAALEIRQPSQRPKNKRQSSDFSTYSAVNTSRM